MSRHISPSATDLVFNRIAAKLLGIPGDQDAIARGEKALPGVIGIVEGQLGKGKWMLGNEFSLVDCGYTPVLNVIEKAGFGYRDFPKVQAYLDACRSVPHGRRRPRFPDCRRCVAGWRARFSTPADARGLLVLCAPRRLVSSLRLRLH